MRCTRHAGIRRAHYLGCSPSDFGPGPVIKGFGQIADVPNAEPIPKDMVIKMAYDVREGGVDAECEQKPLTRRRA